MPLNREYGFSPVTLSPMTLHPFFYNASTEKGYRGYFATLPENSMLYKKAEELLWQAVTCRRISPNFLGNSPTTVLQVHIQVGI